MYTKHSTVTLRGPLPDLFLQPDGTRMTKAVQWQAQREHLLENSVPLAFGHMPPKPDIFRLQHLYSNTWAVTVGTKAQTITFTLECFFPQGAGPHPVVLTGDRSMGYMNDTVIREALSRGLACARFERTLAAPDDMNLSRDFGIYNVWPELDFGALAAWAWMYHRAVDALELIGNADASKIAVTGQSRGGKTSLLAAATDERILFCQSNCSGAFGSGCFRITEHQLDEDRGLNEDLLHFFGHDVPWDIRYWVGPGMEAYIGREADLPFDMHTIKSLIAPRYLLETWSVDDLWCNPRGCWQTHLAAKELFRFLGVDGHMAFVGRYGPHGMPFGDWCTYFGFIADALADRPFARDNGETYYGSMAPAYGWTAPIRED